ncbi:HpcH/HpaI aldolase family protein [Vibrio algarum]|uniref:Aldolase/citrate lyase family protein n=1 Tax=Vibrio algarum TaxID=3020714 RepID=A0ABT4YLP5_9VIBR|nr:aldolase/citrate lyase family protein [Vibrio sp. KJ40-1]MDB1122418.1 aldolase/citrate lyase family protein [Vibrio sp. KJ40-1]
MSLKSKLKNNELTVGSWVTISHPAVVEVLASAGFEWLVIDIEHTTIGLEKVQHLITVIQAKGMKALVRVSKNEEVVIKRVLDAGADGIVVPMVKTKEDAVEAISYAKYPPIGARGVGLYRAQNYGLDFANYQNWVNDELIIIAQIEHFQAVENIEDIIKTDGIDGVIIGPYDLSASMGAPGEYDRKDVQEAIQKVLCVCEENKVPSGFHVIESEPTKFIERANQGCTFLAYSLDFFFLGDSARTGMKKIREALK